MLGTGSKHTVASLLQVEDGSGYHIYSLVIIFMIAIHHKDFVCACVKIKGKREGKRERGGE